ncbi:Kelch repeat and BTB domain-containing 4, partial [Paramuricea clavata]
MGAVLETGQYSDMTFLVRDASKPLLAEDSTADQNGSNCLRAHRVVLASRCDWFRRALTSGMKESIERTIHVYDTDKESFQEFLKFIYTGHLETESKSLENLVELMALSDQYE